MELSGQNQKGGRDKMTVLIWFPMHGIEVGVGLGVFMLGAQGVDLQPQIIAFTPLNQNCLEDFDRTSNFFFHPSQNTMEWVVWQQKYRTID